MGRTQNTAWRWQLNGETSGTEVDEALEQLRETEFDSLTAEVAALEKIHELIQAQLTAAGE